MPQKWTILLILSFTGSSLVSSETNTTVESRHLIVVQSVIVHKEESLKIEHGDKLCINEVGINLQHVIMAQKGNYKQETFEECVQFCAVNWPQFSYVLISYYDAIIIGDEFKCMCAKPEAFINATAVPEAMCRNFCPESNYRCGDANHDLISVHCIHRACQQDSSTAVCSSRLPHDIHGCIKGDLVDWSHAHNVRNFSSQINDETACIWECRDYHPRSMYSLTRFISDGQVLTCSCGYGLVLEPDLLLGSEFCKLIEDERVLGSRINNFYHVNCISDLDSGKPLFNTSERCDKATPVGCIFKELAQASAPHKFSVKFDNTTDPSRDVDVGHCVNGCAAMFPTDSYFAAVQWNEQGSTLECFCVNPDSINASTLGPEVACSKLCGPPGSGLFCGSGSNDHLHPTMSIYCIPEEEFFSSSHSSPVKREIAAEDLIDSYLHEMEGALRYGNFTTEIIIALLTFMCLILIMAVFYLWQARGISSLSRQIM